MVCIRWIGEKHHQLDKVTDWMWVDWVLARGVSSSRACGKHSYGVIL